MPIESRGYRGEEDYERMRRFVVGIQPLLGDQIYASVGELDWWRWTDDDPESIRQARLWLAGGELVGFAWPAEEQVDLVVHPDHRELEDEMLAWVEGFRRRGDGAGATTGAWAYEGDGGRQEALRRRGYEPAEETLHLHRQEIGEPAAAPVLPPGYGLREMAGEADLERRVEAHRATFAPSRMSVAKQRGVIGAPSYRSDLDLVVVAPGGAFAAFATVWLDPANRTGVFEPVGTHPAHRRLGLGTAVLREGLRRLRALGATTAYVTSLGGEAPANALYQAAGFRLVERNRSWRKRL